MSYEMIRRVCDKHVKQSTGTAQRDQRAELAKHVLIWAESRQMRARQLCK